MVPRRTPAVIAVVGPSRFVVMSGRLRKLLIQSPVLPKVVSNKGYWPQAPRPGYLAVVLYTGSFALLRAGHTAPEYVKFRTLKTVALEPFLNTNTHSIQRGTWSTSHSAESSRSALPTAKSDRECTVIKPSSQPTFSRSLAHGSCPDHIYSPTPCFYLLSVFILIRENRNREARLA